MRVPGFSSIAQSSRGQAPISSRKSAYTNRDSGSTSRSRTSDVNTCTADSLRSAASHRNSRCMGVTSSGASPGIGTSTFAFSSTRRNASESPPNAAS